MRNVTDLLESDPQVRNSVPAENVVAALNRPGLSLAALIDTALCGYADRPALGTRAHESVCQPTTGGPIERELLPRFDTITYGELANRVSGAESAWHGDPECHVRPGRHVCIVGGPSLDYVTVDLACTKLGAVVVPLHSDSSVASLAAVFAETAPETVAVATAQLNTVIDCIIREGHTPSRLVVFDTATSAHLQHNPMINANARLSAAGKSVVVETLDDVVCRGKAMPAAPRFDAEADSTAMLLYTSGSTGTPKGAIYTAQLVAKMWAGLATLPAIIVHYMPMSHLAGRLALFKTLAQGGTVYFSSSSDMSTLLDDMAIVRPTRIGLAPRVCDLVYEHYQRAVDVAVRSGVRPVEAACAARLELRSTVADRLVWAQCGTAPISADMRSLMESLLGMPLHDAYGSTEAGAILLDNRVLRPPVTDYRLIDTPELGYSNTDEPYPRGELALRSLELFGGYYKRPEKTAEVFDNDGFYRTGDIVAEIGPDELVLIDRRNNVVKLAQGEFVALSRLEAAYETSPLIRQIFVHGSGERAYLLAVIVPAIPETPRAKLVDAIRMVAREQGLKPYEIPRDFIIESEPFSIDNHLLSGVGKLLRVALEQQYGDRLDRLYVALAEARTSRMLELRAEQDRPVLDVVMRAAGAVLGLPIEDLSAEASFRDSGGDSLSAVTFVTLLRDIFDAELPMATVVSSTASLAYVAKCVARGRERQDKRPTLANVHGPGVQLVRAADIQLDKFVDESTILGASTLTSSQSPATTILITGATGYLGRFVCLAWLERLRDIDGGRLICLVRAHDTDDGLARLTESFAGDPHLSATFNELSKDILEVVAGDLSEPLFGLDEQRWLGLSEEVHHIVHAAALVNHLLGYEHLFTPNVVGTGEVVRLALTGRMKPVSFISTVAVASQVDSAQLVEDGDVRATIPVRTIDDGYANGYGTSKWAGEVLLREAHERCGLPVRIFRSSMILAHDQYRGQVNVTDMFTRLLWSLVTTGLAPSSFYQTGPTDAGADPHFDGLPVGFVAAAIVDLDRAVPAEFCSFNVVNPHCDGISLDSVVDWLCAAGYPVQRISDYGGWLREFELALQALPPSAKSHSVLPLLDAFRHPLSVHPGSTIKADDFRAALGAACGSENDIPNLSRTLIEKYLADLRYLDLL